MERSKGFALSMQVKVHAEELENSIASILTKPFLLVQFKILIWDQNHYDY